MNAGDKEEGEEKGEDEGGPDGDAEELVEGDEEEESREEEEEDEEGNVVVAPTDKVPREPKLEEDPFAPVLALEAINRSQELGEELLAWRG